MYLLHNIGEKINSNYNTREEVSSSTGPLSFDGVYKSVYQNRDLLEGRDTILFITGDYVGKNNSFDAPMPPEDFCDWNEIMEMVTEYHCALGWHTWSHPDLTKMSYEDILLEVTPPFPMLHFAYPYGRFNEEVIEAVQSAGFQYGFSVTEGNGSAYQILRKYL
jgi:hypothetical protein